MISTTHLLLGLLGVVLYMALLWVVSLYKKEADIVDFGWASSVAALGVWYSVIGEGDRASRLMLGAIAGVWGGRLSYHLFIKRVLVPGEDGRYKELRASWGASASKNFLIFFTVQALLAFILSISFIPAVSISSEQVNRVVQSLGLLLAAISICGEAISDAQLARFVRNPANKGKVCSVGLWNYSRHPNYFFEWLCWCSYPLIAWGGIAWWMSLLSPLCMLFLIVKVTGIPPTEARSMVSRPDAYREYQRTTSAFFPWWKKKGVIER